MSEQVFTRAGAPVALVCRIKSHSGDLVRVRYEDGDERDLSRARLVGPSDLHQQIDALETLFVHAPDCEAHFTYDCGAGGFCNCGLED